MQNGVIVCRYDLMVSWHLATMIDKKEAAGQIPQPPLERKLFLRTSLFLVIDELETKLEGIDIEHNPRIKRTFAS